MAALTGGTGIGPGLKARLIWVSVRDKHTGHPDAYIYIYNIIFFESVLLCVCFGWVSFQ